MIIELEKVVSLAYELAVPDANGVNQNVEVANEDEPFIFLFGNSGLPEKFEHELQGLKVGDTFKFSIESNEAFGPIMEENIMSFENEMFLDEDGKMDSEVIVGNWLQLEDDEGFAHRGLVLEIGDKEVSLDFNHPLANKDLFFEGKVLDIRAATPEELALGHVHGEGGHHY